MPALGVIGGSGLTEMPGLEITGEETVTTPWGAPSAPYTLGRLGELQLVFLPRHGSGHTIPPHLVNYRANIHGFRHLGAERILAVGAVGGIAQHLAPGSIVIVDQILDQTQGSRASTFFEGPQVVHVDFTDPYCPELRESLAKGAAESGIDVVMEGTYVATPGPRLESRAEIRHYSAIGGDLVGMTGMPEAVLAREKEICYSAITVVTNHAAGLAAEPLSAKEVVEGMSRSIEKVVTLIGATAHLIPTHRVCPCGSALNSAKL